MSSRMIRIGSGLLVAAVLAGLCAFLWNRHARPPDRPETPQQLSVGAYLGEFSALLWVAESEGLFAANGLEVRIDEYDSGVTPMQKLLAGEVEVATVAEFVAVNHIFDHPDLRILGTIAFAEAIDVVGRRDAGISGPRDLAHKRIGLKKRSQAEFFLGAFLVMHGVSIDDVVVVDTNPAEMEAALLAGSLDAVVVWHPFAYQVARALGENASVWDAQLDRGFFFLLIARESTLSSRPDAVRRFLRAMVQAADYAQDHGEKSRLTVRRRLGSDEPYSKAIWGKLTFEIALPQMLVLAMEDEADWMIRNKLTGAKEAPNYLDNLAVPLLQDVNPEGITIVR